MAPELQPLAYAGGCFAIALVGLIIVRRLLILAFERVAKITETQVDDIVLEAVRLPSLAWIVALALNVAVQLAPIEVALREVLGDSLSVLLILSVSAAFANGAANLLQHAIQRVNPSGGVPAIGLVVLRVVVWSVGAIVALRVMGVEIAPLVTALGVGGLAVALAMQETLGNLFAGLHILIERPLRVGDYVRLDGGQHGYVHDISWRTTRVRTLDDDFVVVPNSKLSGSQLINHHMPHKRSRITTDVWLDFGTDPEAATSVIRAALEDAAAAGAILRDPVPDILLLKLGAWALEFRARFFIEDIADQPRALDVVNRAIVKRLGEAGLRVAVQLHRVQLPRETP